MKKLTIFSMFFMIVLAVSVSAVATITYNFYDADTSQPLNNVQVLAYPCLDAGCDTLMLDSPVLGSGNSGELSRLSIIYPANLVTPHGYAIYYFKEGYAPQEYWADWAGNGATTYGIPFNRMHNCDAPISDIAVYFDEDLESWVLQTNVESAFADADNRIGYVLPDYVDYYSSLVDIRVRVMDESDNIVFERTLARNIYMGNSVSITVELEGLEPGNYTASVRSDVSREDQCDSNNPLRQTAVFEVEGGEPQPEPIEVTLAAEPDTGAEPLDVNLTCSVENGTDPFVYSFYEDGSLFSTITSAETSITITRTFDYGVYNINCSVEDSNAETDSDSVEINVTQAAPTYECSDGIDNDNDTFVDADDPGCYDSGAYDPNDNNETDTLPECSDFFDNDGDSLVDYPVDPGCTSASDDNETDPAVYPECSDGIDNDNDTFVDADDPGCYDSGDYNPFDDDESDTLPECSDFFDNDGDSLVDYPADPGCIDASDDNETDTVCVNHLDISRVEMSSVEMLEGFTYPVDNADIGNGYIPFDYDFTNSGNLAVMLVNYTTTMTSQATAEVIQATSGTPVIPANTTQTESEDLYLPVNLSDGTYNVSVVVVGVDEAGCYQYDIFEFFAEVNTTAPTYECSDGIDNDNDTFVDADDPGCYDSGDYNPFDDDESDTLPECSDFFDNDGDSLIDFPDDPGCVDAGDDNETDPVVLTECSDGIDNDNDTFVDADDPGCYDSGAYDPSDDNETDTLPECSDFFDNDGDSLVDMDDPDCTDSGDDTEQEDDIEVPLVMLLFPADNSAYYTPDLVFIFGVVDDNADMLDCTFYTNITGTFEPAAAQPIPNGFIGFFSYNSIPDGTYIWNVECDDGTYSAFAAWNFTFTVDTTYVNIPADVNITADPESGDESLTVQFSSSVSGNDPISYSWVFGDGHTSSSPNPQHTYADDGTYTATLTITDADGETASDSVTITVADVAPVYQCNDGIDNDDDGLVDMDDPGCESPEDDDEYEEAPECDLHIGRILIYSDIVDEYGEEHVRAGDELFVNVYFENNGDLDLEDLSFRALIMDLGLSNSVNFNLDVGDDTTRTVMIDIPSDTPAGDYDIQISANNDCVSRTRYRMVTVVE